MKKILVWLFAGFVALSLTACWESKSETENKMEEVGDSMEDAAEDAQEGMEDAAEEIEEAADEMTEPEK